MAEIKIIAGFVSNVPSVSRYGFSFLIGDPPVSVYISSLGSPPFSSNEYVAVAVRRSIFSTSRYVALAYRRIGLKAPPCFASLASSVTGLLLGAMGLITWILTPDAPQSSTIGAIGVGATLFGLNGLRGVADAKRLLTEWQPSPDDFDAH